MGPTIIRRRLLVACLECSIRSPFFLSSPVSVWMNTKPIISRNMHLSCTDKLPTWLTMITTGPSPSFSCRREKKNEWPKFLFESSANHDACPCLNRAIDQRLVLLSVHSTSAEGLVRDAKSGAPPQPYWAQIRVICMHLKAWDAWIYYRKNICSTIQCLGRSFLVKKGKKNKKRRKWWPCVVSSPKCERKA